MRASILSVFALLFLVGCPSSTGKGTEGPAGPAGPQGVAGERGETGATGPTGPTGPQGPAGPIITLDGGVIAVGLSVTVLDGGACPFGGVKIDLDGGPAFVCNGAPGLQGPIGVTGPAGSIGLTGPAGPAGPTGAPGAAGAIGPAGPTGAPGAAGAIGPAGPMGAPGAAGAIGPAGPMGATGAAGAIGPAGPTGATGSTGPAGPMGATGPAGQGVPGPTGAPGPAGTLYGELTGVFAGFTTATTNGAPGGRHALHALCASQFAGSHACHATELTLANLAAPIPGGAVWVDTSGTSENGSEYLRHDLGTYDYGRYTSQSNGWNCVNWTALTYASGSYTYPTSGLTLTPSGYTSANCSQAHPVACCSTPYREKFRGYTPTSFTGEFSGAGRTAPHAQCANAFPGSHFCHASELTRSHVSSAPPAGGVWVDTSGVTNGGSEYLRHDLGVQRYGRYTSASNGWNCVNWTAVTYASGSYTYPTNGLTYTATGYTSGLCNVARPLACCE